MEREIERHLRWLMVLRVATVTTLLLSVFLVDLVFTPVRSPEAFYGLALFLFAVSGVYSALYPRLRRSHPFLVAQLGGDAVAVTAVVHFTGGPGSAFSFLYIGVVLAGSVFLYRRGAFAMAGFCWLLYAGLAGLALAGWRAPGPPPPDTGAGLTPARLLFLLAVHLAGFLLAALLASHVAGNLRRAREELLRHREQVTQLQAYHENIIGSIPSGLITTDEAGRVDFVNPGAEQILGRGSGDLLGGGIGSILAREVDFLPGLQRELEGSGRVRFEDWLVLPSGERSFLGFTVSKLRDRHGEPLGFIFSFQDLTDRKALEEEVRLQQHMAAIGGIAARMAHEIRNPLASITGSVQLLGRELPMAPEHRDLMGIILKESRRLDGTLRDFLAYARPPKVRPERVDAVDLVREAVQLLRNSEECLEGHRIVTRFPAAAVHARLDPNRVREVIWNLARNGLKAMPRGGTLTVGVEGREDGRFSIFFQDEGVGMTPAEMEECFQPFRGRFAHGTGLGLSIVYRVVREHGGRVQIRSEQGRGTRVDVLLPAEREVLAAVGA